MNEYARLAQAYKQAAGPELDKLAGELADHCADMVRAMEHLHERHLGAFEVMGGQDFLEIWETRRDHWQQLAFEHSYSGTV